MHVKLRPEFRPEDSTPKLPILGHPATSQSDEDRVTSVRSLQPGIPLASGTPAVG